MAIRLETQFSLHSLRYSQRCLERARNRYAGERPNSAGYRLVPETKESLPPGSSRRRKLQRPNGTPAAVTPTTRRLSERQQGLSGER